MIPAYTEEIKIVFKEADSNAPMEQQVRQLQEQMRHLVETVEYINRERSRLKAEVEDLKHRITKG
jgi:regulator of replication initiation timing